MVSGEGARRSARGKLSTTYRNNTAILRWLLCAELALVGGPAMAGGALPTGGQFVAGQGTITGSSSALTVNQSSNHGIINWQGFSIGTGNRVQFNNGSGATLNRVTGKNLSRIDGSLSATGSVYLINPQGVVVGSGGKVVTNGSFVASTRDVSNSAFMNGGPLSASGTSNGDVINAGTITSATGDAILVGRAVKNTGSVSAPNGTAVMAAGNQILLQPVGGDSRIAVSGGKGDVTNAGTVKAAQAALASAGGNVYALVENNGGINATGTANVDGHVWLTAGGTAQVTGNVSATNANGSGGTFIARAQNISVTGTVDASATKAGKNGGAVSIIATGDTAVSGTVKAKGQAGGKGGTIETSGHTLEIGGATVDAGEGGQWLLDPYDLTVDSSAASTIDSSLGAGTDVTLQTTASGTSGPGTANASGNGDILVESALSWSSAATLTLDAYHSIGIDAPITISGAGGVVLKTNDNSDGIADGDYTFSKGGALFFTGGSGSGATLEINSTPYTLLYDMAGVQNINASDAALHGNYALAISLDALTDGTTPASWIPIGTDGYGDIGDFPNGFSGVFEGLGHTISNLTVSNLRLNNIDHNYYYYNDAGLFGASSGTIRDIGVVGGSVTGGGSVGGLAGYNSGIIRNAYSTATVTAIASSTVGTSGTNDGGLVGWNVGTIHNVYASGSVTGNGLYIGGLVGSNGGTIEDAYSTGAVGGTGSNMGGLAGYSGGTITDSYWDTQTSGQPSSAGGTGLTTAELTGSMPSGFSPSIWGNADNGSTPYLLALTSGTQTGYTGDGSGGQFSLIFTLDQLQDINSNLAGHYALANSLDATGAGWTPLGTDGAGNISNSGNGFSGIFDGLDHTISNLSVLNSVTDYYGLFGYNSGTIRNIGLNGGSVLGRTDVGALAGYNTGSISNAWADVDVNGAESVGGLIGENNGGTIANSHSDSPVEAHGLYAGGLVGRQDSGSISQSYATGAVSSAIVFGGATLRDSGGLIGWLVGGTISQSYATGSVTGLDGLGGFVGVNDGGSISQSYATGIATGRDAIGGFAGSNGGQITDSYATGAAIGTDPASVEIGALVGYNSGSITDAYATGYVSGAGTLGGLVGYYASGTITDSFWDTETSGQSTSSGAGTGLTTAQLQGALPSSNWDAGVWGTGPGLFPYFKWQYPSAPKAIAGIAYSNFGVTPLKGGTVSIFADGNTLGSASTGANGYYYAMAPSGGLSAASDVLATTSTGARIDTGSALLDANGNVKGFDIWDSTLIASTTRATYSDAEANLLSDDIALINAADGNDAAITSFASGLAQHGFIASGDFTLDEALTLSNGLYVKSAGNITVADAMTLPGATALVLSATGALTINAPVNVTGAGGVSLRAGTDTLTIPGISLVELSFGAGASIDYGSVDNGGTLNINGAAYTLLYTMGALQNVNNALSANYALATSLNAATDGTTPANWIPLGLNSAGSTQNSGNGFNGTFDGLGHTISNLSIAFNHLYAGLFGSVHGKIRNVGLVGGSVTSSSQQIGGLVGYLNNGVLYNAYSSANVTASATAGGLIGLNSGYVARTYATGAIKATGSYAGGLVGQNSNQIVDSYATGAVNAVTGKAGGLVGMNTTGFITNAYATGTVSGSDYVGGLVGRNNGTGNNITNVYSTGYVISGGANVGGLVGNNNGTVTNGYWDTETSGQSTSNGGTGLTTAQLQDMLPSGFDGSVWGTGAGLYPYFLWQYSTAPDAISGVAYSDNGVTPLQGGAVNALVDGANLGSVNTGANGYFYFLEPSGTISGSGSAVLAYTSGGARLDTLTGSSSDFDIWGNNTLIAPTSDLLYSGAIGAPLQTQDAVLLAQALGANADPTTGLTNYGYIATGDFIIDQSLTLSNGLYVKSAGDITVVDALTLSGANGLALRAGHALDINAPISVTGAGAVNLGYDASDPANLDFGLTVNGFTGGVDYGATDNGGKLLINGTPYTLLYDMGGVQAINTALDGNYALATSLDASGVSGWVPVGNGAAEFTGNFEGLGHTIADLTVTASGDVGLFGKSGGTIRDTGLQGGRVTGGTETGSLLGMNSGGVVAYNWSSASVTSSTDNADVGGLVGYSDATITHSFATGAVTSTGQNANVGGLVGMDFVGTISQSFATGAVTGSDGAYIGGLLGLGYSANLVSDYAMGSVTDGGDNVVAGGLMGLGYYFFGGGGIDQTYAIGAVSANGTGSVAGGLIGQNLGGTITNSYWDTETSGLSTSDGGTGQTTRQLQGSVSFSDGGAFDLTTWSAQEGLFPYLASFFPNGAMALSGTAYGDGGAVPLPGGTVTAAANGKSLGTVSVGANGYYYFLEPIDAIASGSALIAYSGTGARLDTSDDALDTNNNLSGFDIWGSTLIAPTATDTYTAAIASDLRTEDAAMIATALGGDATGANLVAGLTRDGYIASGDFTIDRALTLSNGLYVRSMGSITVADALTLPGTNALTLSAPNGSVNFNASVTVTDGGTLTFGAPCGCGDYMLADGVSIDFTGGPSAGAHLVIDGDSYTLLYDMGDDATGVQGINDSDDTLGGFYALATSLDASTDPTTPAAWTPIGTDGTSFGILNHGDGFTGIFAGLGHAISNLSIDMSGVSNAPIGLFGYSSGELRDVSVTGASVKGGDGTAVGILVGDNEGTVGDASASGDVTITGSTGASGATAAGGLVGYNAGVVALSHASGTVTILSDGDGAQPDVVAGGLVGYNDGAIYISDASTDVTGQGNASVGGLAGYSDVEVAQSNATGTVIIGDDGAAGGLVGFNDGGIVMDSHATGGVNGGYDATVGGLVGYNDAGEIIQSYASGDVSSGEQSAIGGLVGVNGAGHVTDSYATGTVVGSSNSAVGGLVGYNDFGTVTSSYATGDVMGGDYDGDYTGFSLNDGPFAVGGLVGFNDAGIIDSSYATGNVSAGNDIAVGGLAGYNDGGISQSYATGNVSGNDGAYVGGLIGYNDYDGLVALSFAMGAVTTGDAFAQAGGLAGYNDGGITQSFAIGSVNGGVEANVGGLIGWNDVDGLVNQSYATGSATGGDGAWAGGLVGENNGDIDQAYAMGVVRVGANTPSYSAEAGGLVGHNEGTIEDAFATGMVLSSDPAAFVGGVVGEDVSSGGLQSTYWDTDTSGIDATQGTGNNGSSADTTGLSTAALQDNGTLTDWDFAAVWGTGFGLYPYFQWQYPTTPQAISGTVYTGLNGTTLLPGATIAAISGGMLAGTGASGANGYYYVLPMPGTLNSAGVLTYLAGNAVKGGMFTDDVTDAVAPFYRQLGADNIYGGTTTVWTPDSNLSTALGNLTATLGTISNSDLGLTATASSLEADAGGIAVVDPFGNDLTIDGSLTALGAIDVAAWGGNITLAPGASLSSAASGDAIQIYAGNFVNNAGSSVLSLTGSGRWLVYSNDPVDDVFGGLDSGNTAVWDVTTSPTIPVPTVSVTQDGNRYLFAYRPTLSITTTDLAKTYGDDATANVANAYNVSGYEAGVSGAFLGDDAASVYSGAPSVTSTGSAPTADVSAGPYEIDASLGSLTFLNGYAVSFVNTGTLTVDQAHLTVTAHNDGKTYNGLAYNGGNGVSYSGFVNGQDSSALFGSPIYDGSAQGAVNAGLYTITVSGLASTNYAITYNPGVLTVNKAPLLVTANNDSKTYDGAAYSGGNAVSYSGFVNGEGTSALSGTLAYGGAAQGAVNAGNYALLASGLTSGNYVITYDPGTLTVAARPITVTADDLSRIYGAANPTLTYAVGGSGLVNGDTLSGNLGTAANVASNVGNYAIVQGSLVASANYALTFVPGTLTINPAALSITANDVTTPTLSAAQFSASYAGFLNGDNSSVVSGLEYGVFPITGNALNYDIVPFGATASNYTITFFPGLLTLVPQQPGGIPAPLIGDNGYNSSSSFGVSFGANSFAFSNVATASVGTGNEILLFEAGLPGIISPFQAVAISDYSNATNSEDQLINCQSAGQNGQGTCGVSGGTGL